MYGNKANELSAIAAGWAWGKTWRKKCVFVNITLNSPAASASTSYLLLLTKPKGGFSLPSSIYCCHSTLHLVSVPCLPPPFRICFILSLSIFLHTSIWLTWCEGRSKKFGIKFLDLHTTLPSHLMCSLGEIRKCLWVSVPSRKQEWYLLWGLFVTDCYKELLKCLFSQTPPPVLLTQEVWACTQYLWILKSPLDFSNMH